MSSDIEKQFENYLREHLAEIIDGASDDDLDFRSWLSQDIATISLPAKNRRIFREIPLSDVNNLIGSIVSKIDWDSEIVFSVEFLGDNIVDLHLDGYNDGELLPFSAGSQFLEQSLQYYYRKGYEILNVVANRAGAFWIRQR